MVGRYNPIRLGGVASSFKNVPPGALSRDGTGVVVAVFPVHALVKDLAELVSPARLGPDKWAAPAVDVRADNVQPGAPGRETHRVGNENSSLHTVAPRVEARKDSVYEASARVGPKQG